jgi:stage IV sporulation protein FB
MKKIFRVNYLTYIVALIAVLTAHFKLYLSFMLLIIIHEFGHILFGLLFNWKLREIVILPLGMISKYNNSINISMKEEMVVASMGIIFQLIFYLLFLRNNSIFYLSNLIIIVFNLLPIYPLDGSKILNIFLNKFFSFQLSYYITIYLSIILNAILLFVSIINKDIIVFIIFIPLFINLIKEYRNIPNVINKFYLERILYHFNFNNIKYINGIKTHKMKRDFYHYFKYKNKVLSEEKILANLFDKL